jgi:hypothetical protein
VQQFRAKMKNAGDRNWLCVMSDAGSYDGLATGVPSSRMTTRPETIGVSQHAIAACERLGNSRCVDEPFGRRS